MLGCAVRLPSDGRRLPGHAGAAAPRSVTRSSCVDRRRGRRTAAAAPGAFPPAAHEVAASREARETPATAVAARARLCQPESHAPQRSAHGSIRSWRGEVSGDGSSYARDGRRVEAVFDAERCRCPSLVRNATALSAERPAIHLAPLSPPKLRTERPPPGARPHNATRPPTHTSISRDVPDECGRRAAPPHAP